MPNLLGPLLSPRVEHRSPNFTSFVNTYLSDELVNVMTVNNVDLVCRTFTETKKEESIGCELDNHLPSPEMEVIFRSEWLRLVKVPKVVPTTCKDSLCKSVE